MAVAITLETLQRMMMELQKQSAPCHHTVDFTV